MPEQTDDPKALFAAWKRMVRLLPITEWENAAAKGDACLCGKCFYCAARETAGEFGYWGMAKLSPIPTKPPASN